MKINKTSIFKFALGIEYDGTSYHGWQKQKQKNTIQKLVEDALSVIANHKIDIVCAGRTDKGVHSLGQVIHFNTMSVRHDQEWINGTNAHLPDDICVKWIKRVSKYFNARKHAIFRFYRYIIYNDQVRSAIFNRRCNFIYKDLDVNNMNIAAQSLIGEHDFTSFRGKGCQSTTPWRNIIDIRVFRFNFFVIIDIQANSFLYHMVRNIAGSLIEIGLKKKAFVGLKMF